jgi:hypothetical protein
MATMAVLVGWAAPAGCDKGDPSVTRRDLKIISRAKRTTPRLAGDDMSCTTKRLFHRDADGDGFGDPKKSVQACKAPPGFVNNAKDCYDKNRRVHPGQRDYYAVHRGDGGYDYDCDGRQTRRFVARAFCRVKENGGCALASGWGRGKVPKCGQPAVFSWKVCREQVLVKPPPSVDAGVATTQSAGALVPGAKQKKVYRCGGRKLPWKKRQLCR